MDPDAQRAIEHMILGREGVLGKYRVTAASGWGAGYAVRWASPGVANGLWALWVVEHPGDNIGLQRGDLVAWSDFAPPHPLHGVSIEFGRLFPTLEHLLGFKPDYSPTVASNMAIILGPLGVAAWRAELLAREQTTTVVENR